MMIDEKQQNVLDLLRQIYKITNELLEEYGNMPNVAQEINDSLYTIQINVLALPSLKELTWPKAIISSQE